MTQCNTQSLLKMVETCIDDLKGKDVAKIDVTGKATFTDFMVFATGSSTRHVKAIAQEIIAEAKKQNCAVFGSEGEVEGEWVLVDLGDVVAHIMLQETRDFYQLEELWGTPSET